MIKDPDGTKVKPGETNVAPAGIYLNLREPWINQDFSSSPASNIDKPTADPDGVEEPARYQIFEKLGKGSQGIPKIGGHDRS